MIETAVGSLKVRVEGASPGRAVAVLWHSLFVDERTWDRVVPDLAQDRRLVIITGPGHGASGDPGRRYTLQDCADAATAVLHACAITEPVDWVGNAWGGHAGIVLAALRPELIRTLVTAGTPVHPYPLPQRLQTQLVLLPLYRVLGPVGLLTTAVVEALLSESTRAHDEAATGLVRDCFIGADTTRMANAVVSISLRREDFTPLLGSVRAPTPVPHRLRAPRLVARADPSRGRPTAPRIQRRRRRRRLPPAAGSTDRLLRPGAPVLGAPRHSMSAHPPTGDPTQRKVRP
jgi:pimeloyl-ACP methyl ester carboxylesterase